MKFKTTDEQLTVLFSGRIDTTNSEAISNELTEIYNGNKRSSVILDFEDVDYISSAGLRFILRFKRMVPDLSVLNTSPEVYEIFEMTGFTQLMTIKKRFRKFSVDGCKVIGKGAKGTVYRIDPETIIKVYNSPDCLADIKKEQDLAKKAFILGIPTAISYDVVKVDDTFGAVYELLDSSSLSLYISNEPANINTYAGMFAELLKNIHETEVNPKEMPDAKNLVFKWIEEAEPFLNGNDGNILKGMIYSMESTNHMVHGDFHTNNVMIQDNEAMLIDMDTLSHGNPIFDLANIYITYVGFARLSPDYVEGFLGFPFELAKKFWSSFLPLYLGTNKPEKIKDVEDKTRLLSDVRLIRHIVRRSQHETEEGKKLIEELKNEISELLQGINKLSI